MPKRLLIGGIKGCKYKTSALLLFLTFSVLVANPKKTTLHGGQSRSWSAKQGKENKRRSLAAYPPPIPLTARSEKNSKKKNHATHLQASSGDQKQSKYGRTAHLTLSISRTFSSTGLSRCSVMKSCHGKAEFSSRANGTWREHRRGTDIKICSTYSSSRKKSTHKKKLEG